MDFFDPQGRRVQRQSRGFTLIELLVVVAIVGIAAGVASLSLRDPDATRLEREASRLAALLESARAAGRAAGISVMWDPVDDSNGDQFRFEGLPSRAQLPKRWLGERISVEIAGAKFVTLGPEPLIGPQRILLTSGDQKVVLATDGLTAFGIVTDTPR